MNAQSKTPRILILIAILALLAPAVATAQQRSGVGLGIVIGEPSGISAISWLGGGNAVDFVAAWSFSGPGSIYVHADYQFHGWIEQPLSAFVGLGGVLILQEQPLLGVRVPFGLTFLFQEVPMDVFVEVAPGVTLGTDTLPLYGGGIGFRFYF
ncbi:MAG: hypothetical protein ACOC0O_04985 [Spirochaetota bacterium]